MAETGWPLIPRDGLPTSPPSVAKGVRRVPVSPHDAGRQLPIFGAETTEPSPFDLAGLLAGPGRLDRMGGTARVSVRVDAAWRVHVLVAELVARGLVVNWRPTGVADADVTDADVADADVADADVTDADVADTGVADTDQVQKPEEGVRVSQAPPESGVPGPGVGEDVNPVQDHGPASETPEGRRGGSGPVEEQEDESVGQVGRLLRLYEVRTAYSSRLNGLARAWPAAADQLFLSGPRLRLWVAAAGRPLDGGYALGLGSDNPDITVDAAMRRAGLDGVVSDHGHDYLISGRKRLHRLAELVGERPVAAPDGVWPGGAGA